MTNQNDKMEPEILEDIDGDLDEIEAIAIAEERRKAKVTKFEPQQTPESLGFKENSDYFLKPMDLELWKLYYHKKEYRK